jgi:type IV pilus assembly protein PilE
MKYKRKNLLGFTILELLVVVAIIGILGAIGTPLYQGYVTKARETKAQNTLQSIYMMEKNFFSQNYCYYMSPSSTDDTSNINSNLFGSQTPLDGPIQVASNDFLFYITGTVFTCAGTSCICTTANATDFKAYAVSKSDASKIFTVNHQNVKTGF